MSDDLEWIELPPMSEAERQERLRALEARMRSAPLEACDHCGKRARVALTKDPDPAPGAKNDPSLWCQSCWLARATVVIEREDDQ